MIRSGFKRKVPSPDSKPPSSPKPKRCAVKGCRAPFHPDRPFVTWCSPECGEVVALNKVAKQKAAKAKAERAETKKKLDAIKPRNDHVKDAQRAFNAFIRHRDKDMPCICCGRATTSVDGLGAHGWDCGHFRSVGSAPHLRFNEDNAHRQLVYCNRHGSGRAVDYRIGLIKRIGIERVEALEADDTPRKWTVEQLIEIKKHYSALVRAAKKGE